MAVASLLVWAWRYRMLKPWKAIEGGERISIVVFNVGIILDRVVPDMAAPFLTAFLRQPRDARRSLTHAGIIPHALRTIYPRLGTSS